MGSFEIYRKFESSSLKVERQTVHVSDDIGRIAMLEKRTVGSSGDDNGTDAVLTRYIYSNHLQSASLELDETGDIISYEEYHPYGTTSYQAINASIKAVAKRYRYTGKERDDESGLYYHGARYYIPWLARWASCDPLESKYAGLSPYNYSFNNPVMYNDPSGMEGEGVWHEYKNRETNELAYRYGTSDKDIRSRKDMTGLEFTNRTFSTHDYDDVTGKHTYLLSNGVHYQTERADVSNSFMGNSFQRYAVTDEGLGYFGDKNRIYNEYLASSSYRKQEEYLKNEASYKVLISPTISALTDYDIFLLEQQRKARHYMRMDAMGRINPVIGAFQFGSSLISDPIISGYSSYKNFSAGNYTEGTIDAGITFLSIAPVTKGIGKVAGKTGTNTIYRVVSKGEAGDVLANGFRQAPISSGISSYEGKLFWTNMKDAKWYQNWVGEGNQILKIKVSNSFIFENGADVGRQFYYVSPERLQQFNSAIKSIK